MAEDSGTAGGQRDSGRGGEPLSVGPYGSWTYGRGSAYADLAVPLAEARFVPAMVTLPPGLKPEALAERRSGPARVFFPELWLGLRQRDAEPMSWPAIIDFGDPRERPPLDTQLVNSILRTLGEGPEGVTSAVFSLGAPLPQTIVATTMLTSPRPVEPDPRIMQRLQNGGGRLTVMAVIDDGIPFAHRNLMNEAGDSTRIEHCWLQSAKASGKLLFGKHFTRSDIDALRAAHGPDEDAIYHRAGALDAAAGSPATLGHHASHGAHVIDAAAGLRSSDADMDLMRVIAVQLPAAFTIDTTGFRKDGPVLAAMHTIFARADAIAAAYLGDADAPMPLVINFSYGFTGGPHDGSDPLEIAMAKLVADRIASGKPTELVMPAGNSFADRCLGEIPPDRLLQGRAADIPWRLQPNDATASYLELWIPSGGGSSYALSLTDPLGRLVDAATPLTFTAGGTSVAADLSVAGTAVGDISIQVFSAAWTLVRIALAPTEPRKTALPAAPAGCWTIALTLTGGPPPEKPVACRVHRDNDPFGYRRGGRQSYLDDAADERFGLDGAPSRTDSPPEAFVRRFGTLNGIATHDRVTVVSSYFADTGRATAYASAGPVGASGVMAARVRFSLPADSSTALPGALAGGTRSGSAIRLSGTSMAAPLYARRIALGFMRNLVAPPQAVALALTVSPRENAERTAKLGVAISG
jgi:hypothetical protein